MSFDLNDLVKIAKRENNTKRNYIIVNPKQGKHVPVSPNETMELFNALAEKVKQKICGKKTLIISFAETATAIGAYIACYIKDTFYIQTTRENIKNAEYIYFFERHSHAVEQKLVKNNLIDTLNKISEIVFIDDEITTGNTILELANEIKKYSDDIHFMAVSILNGMNSESVNKFNKYGIDVLYLEKTENENYASIADRFKYNDNTIIADTVYNFDIDKNYITGFVNPRLLTNGIDYYKACQDFAQKLKLKNDIPKDSNILVIGTEEFMYPALLAALELEKTGLKVNFHATTRSPILTSDYEGYPLFSRYKIISPYNIDRVTFIYNLKKYDYVFIVTDADIDNNIGINSIINAFKNAGNKNIKLFRWC